MPAGSMQDADQHSAGSPPDLTPFRLCFAVPLQQPDMLCWLEIVAIMEGSNPGMHRLEQDDQQQACLQDADQHSANLAGSPPDSTPFRLCFAVPLQQPDKLCWLEILAISIREGSGPGMHRLEQDDQQQACLQD